MKRSKLITIALALCLSLVLGVAATGCSGGSSTPTDGKATSQELYDATGKLFSDFFTSNYTDADANKLATDLLALMPKKMRESSEAKSLASSFSAKDLDGSDTETLKQIREYCDFGITCSQGPALSSSQLKALQTAVDAYGKIGTVEEAYQIKMALKLALSKDYAGFPKGHLLGSNEYFLGSDSATDGAYAAKIGGRWYIV